MPTLKPLTPDWMALDEPVEDVAQDAPRTRQDASGSTIIPAGDMDTPEHP